jgi:peroxiredoxin Q/BCP
VRDELVRFHDAGAQPLGVNPADVRSHAAYARKMHLEFPLLSDVDRAIARAYGALKDDGIGIQRTVYAIRSDGTVALGVRGAPAPTDILAALAT